MRKFKIFVLWMGMALVSTPAFCQADHQVKTVTGTVTRVDTVGNVISIQEGDQSQVAFAVPDKTPITWNTTDIGLMDVKEGNPVTVQYYSPTPAKFVAVSIVDNKRGDQ